MSSLRIRWTWIFCEILPVFDQNSSRNAYQYSDQEFRWPRNCCEILFGVDQNFFQELDDPRILLEFFKDYDQNSDDYWVLRELYDLRTLVKCILDFNRILQKLDEHRILLHALSLWVRILLASTALISKNSEDLQEFRSEFWNCYEILQRIWIRITFKNYMTMEL